MSSVDDCLIVIGVGASAGGLEALQEFLKNLPIDKNISCIIAQHLSPTHKSMLVALLARETKYDVVEATDQQIIEKGKIYITPSNKDIQVRNHQIVLTSLVPDSISPRPSVDKLFASMSENYRENMIAIILSGTGHDGAKGAKVVRVNGGIVIAQDPLTAKYDGMPRAVISENLADIILPPYQMGRDLDEIISFLKGDKDLFPHQEETDIYQSIMEQIGKVKGVDFSQYRPTTINRRIKRRMVALKVSTLYDYYAMLLSNPNEVHNLYKDILIGVTSFFRDAGPFDDIKEYLNQSISKHTDENFRVWIAGCSSGEEAYSFSILLNELFLLNKKSSKIQIFATDIDEDALSYARKGTYPSISVEDIGPELRLKYFTSKNDSYTIKKSIRDAVIFSKHDVTQNPPFLNIDLIVCRNLLIYFNVELQNKVLQYFHFSLNHYGILFLGKSESLGDFEGFFKCLGRNSKIFQKELTSLPQNYLFRPTHQYRKKNQEDAKQVNSPRTMRETLIETLGQSFLPLSVVINEGMEILYSNQNNPFLTVPQGQATTNILKMIHPELALELRSVVHRSLKEKELIKSSFVRVELYGNIERFVRILAVKAIFEKDQVSLIVLGFQEESIDVLTLLGCCPNPNLNVNSTNVEVLRLERELNKSKAHLQTVIEELETSNEELQSLNEELQSSNEELQSSNEELETTNEELQSTNEELETAYNELKIVSEEREELRKESEDRANELDLQNKHLEGINNASLSGIMSFQALRDQSGRIIDFICLSANKIAVKYFSSDNNGLIGKRFVEVFPESIEKGLLSKLSFAIENEKTLDGEYFFSYEKSQRCLKYCAVKLNNGMLMTFNDVTAEKEYLDKLNASEVRLKAATSSGLISIWEYDAINEIICWDKKSSGPYQTQTEMKILKFNDWMKLIHPNDQFEVKISLKNSLNSGSDFSQELRMVTSNESISYVKIIAAAIKRENNVFKGLTGIIINITDSKLAEEKIVEFEKNYHKILDTQNNIVTINNGKGLTDVNAEFFKVFKEFRTLHEFKRKYNCICDLFEKIDDEGFLYDGKKGQSWLEILSENPEKNFQVKMKVDGQLRCFIIKHHLAHNKNCGQEEKNIVVFTDITELNEYRHQLEQRVQKEISIRRENEKILIQQSKLAAMGEMIGAIAHQWRQPLNVISLSNAMLEELWQEVSKDKNVEEALDVIKTSNEQIVYLTQTIDDFRSFFSPRNNIEKFDLFSIIDSSYSFYRHQYENYSIDYQCQLRPNQIMISGVANQLRQVLLNLFSNSKDVLVTNKVTRPKVEITAVIENNEVIINFMDNAGGVPQEIISKIFEPYFSTKGPIHGFGIGLYMNKLIVEKTFKGSITVANGTEGAIFTMRLPLERSA